MGIKRRINPNTSWWFGLILFCVIGKWMDREWPAFLHGKVCTDLADWWQDFIIEKGEMTFSIIKDI